MNSDTNMIRDTEVRNLVTRLLDFLGPREVRKRLGKYERSLATAGPIFRDYYLKSRHPWWEGLRRYFELDRAAKSIRRHLTPEIETLAVGAKKVTELARLMPDPVKTKYKTNLLENDTAHAHLFELDVAWHFFTKGYSILWCEGHVGKHCEFIVEADGFKCGVECKRVSVDSYRKIHRRDFYRLVERLCPRATKAGCCGRIRIELEGRLQRTDEFLNGLSGEVIGLIDQGKTSGTYPISSGIVFVDLTRASNRPVDLRRMYEELWVKKGKDAHGVIFASSHGGRPVDPLEVILVSKHADNVLRGIRSQVRQAATDQLDAASAGFIACFLEGVAELKELASDSGLQRVTCNLLGEDRLAHIAAIAYQGEMLVREDPGARDFFNQGLIWRNPNCKFAEAKTFDFLSPPV